MEPVTAAKAAVFAVKNKDSVGKTAACIAGVALAPLLIIIVCAMQLVSAFIPDGAVKGADSYNAYESTVYRSITEVLKPYYESLEEQMGQVKKEIEDAHMVTETVTNEKGETVSIERCTARVSVKMSYLGEGILISWLIHTGALDTETAAVHKAEAAEFLSSVVEIKTAARNEKEFTVYNEFLAKEEIADLYFKEGREKEDFLLSCQAYEAYFETNESQFLIDGDGFYIGEVEESLLTVPLYLQYQEPWGGNPYGNGTIKRNGCCPTCIAMAVSYLNKQHIYPDEVAAWAGKTYYVDGAGTAWSIFDPAARHWNLQCANIGKDINSMINALGKGKPVIASMGPGTFTKSGHFIVLTGITGSGKIKVNDPNDNSIKKHSEKEYEAGLILRECLNMWVFEQE